MRGAGGADAGGEGGVEDTLVGVGTLVGVARPLGAVAALGVGGDADKASILSGDGVALYVCPRDCDCECDMAANNVQ